MARRPYPCDGERMVSGNRIKNSPTNISDICNANTIFGPDAVSLHGKTARRTPEIILLDYLPIPPDILDKNSEFDITEYLMFVNKIPFLVTLGQQVRFTTV